MTPDIKSLMRECGLVGAGGAGFPSYAKLSEGADTLIINASECEPLLHTDYEILRQHLDMVVAGAELIAEALSIPRVILAVKEHTSHGLGLAADEAFGKCTRVFLLPNMYPMGDDSFHKLICNQKTNHCQKLALIDLPKLRSKSTSFFIKHTT